MTDLQILNLTISVVTAFCCLILAPANLIWWFRYHYLDKAFIRHLFLVAFGIKLGLLLWNLTITHQILFHDFVNPVFAISYRAWIMGWVVFHLIIIVYYWRKKK